MNRLVNKNKVLVLLLVISLSSTIILVSAKSDKKIQPPIRLDFKKYKPDNSVRLEEENLIYLEWKNSDKQQSYEGYFVLMLSKENGSVLPSDILLLYKGQIVEAIVLEDGLEYHLPSQVFQSRESGFIEIVVSYFKPGNFVWEFAVAQII